MKRVLRIIGVVLLLVLGLSLIGGGLFALEVFSRKPQIAVRSTNDVSIGRGDCLECHAPIAAEWRESYHYKSLSGPYWKAVQQAGYVDLFNKLRKACVNCHAPANVLDLPVDAQISVGSAEVQLGVECTPNLLKEPRGIIPAARSDDVQLGVDCVSCHVSKHGITGAGHRPTSEHATLADRRFQDPVLASEALCGTCHRSAVDAWKNTKFAREGVTCLDCHMPTVDAPSITGGPQRRRRSHRFLADKDEGMLRNAMNATLEITGNGKAVFRMTNDRVGHHLPSGANALVVHLKALDGSGQVLSEHKETLTREEPLLLDFWPFNVDKRLPFGKQKEILLSLPQGHGKVEATVRYYDWSKAKTILTLTKDF